VSVIANTTIISNFSAIEQLRLLRRVWPRLYITEQVFTEVQTAEQQGYLFYRNIGAEIYPLSDSGWIHLTTMQTPDELRLYGELLGRLHHGEASCLAVAHFRQWTFLTDDRAARTVARRLQVRVSGTLGALVQLIKGKTILVEQADTLLGQMVERGYYSPVTSIKELLTNDG
jgi:predicted nucleic acid-binding protein